MSVVHDRAAYRLALLTFLDVLDRRLAEEKAATSARLWAAGFLARASRLLRNGLTLVDANGPNDGVAVLARTAYESTILGVWILADEGRSDVLVGELHRRQSQGVREVWHGQAIPPRVLETLGALDELAPQQRIPPLEQIVTQVADWVTETEQVVAYVLGVKAGDPAEPIQHSGEPYRSTYVALYRHLSTYAAHGAGAVVELIDADTFRLRPKPGDPPHVEPSEVLVLVGALLADAAARLLGARVEVERIEWHSARSGLRAAVRAVIEDEPDEWLEYLQFVGAIADESPS